MIDLDGPEFNELPDVAKSGIRVLAKECHPVGSRVTCDPAPMDTDADYLVYMDKACVRPFVAILMAHDYDFNGSRIEDATNALPDNWRFKSFKRGVCNIILTASEDFCDRFLAASHVCKRLNLLNKEDRIAVFQAVLYANKWANEREPDHPMLTFEGAEL